MSFTPRRPTSDTTELAKERNREAAERTLTSWIQNCLALIGFGTAFDSIFDAVNHSFPQNSSAINKQLTHIIGLSTIGWGIFLLILVLVGYRAEIKSLERSDYLDRPPHFFNLSIIIGAVILYGLIALVVVFIIKT